ncbi:MAG: 1-deoxy-D-xylulose-5-phosphate reductoisomerase [Candidatus Omnitrophica bacterium]|nr:1-deoxy-D-xylulose-5-phosphate reductoisomerase [Candidatus Omnitrophota bacterium]
MKNIAIFGSTGSIGQNTLEVIRGLKNQFRVVALTANSNIELLYRQIKSFRPSVVCVKDRQLARSLRRRLGSSDLNILVGEIGLEELAGYKGIDQIVMAISGSGALKPLLSAIENCKTIALANKEALVMAGALIMQRACVKKARIIPVDSEQSAIWQCLEGEDKSRVRSIYLTASGGPFFNTPKEKLKHVSVAKVLEHPRWRMGKKISVDSATLINKGLELLEAMYLFDISAQKIKVLIHPQAIVHSMVEFVDGVVMAELSATDMRIPIQYALSYPKRLLSKLKPLDFYKLKELDFRPPDFVKFPCLRLAYQVAEEGGTAPSVLNAADEVAVAEFLKGKIAFLGIPKLIEKVLSRHRNKNNPGLSDIFLADRWAREESAAILEKGVK